MNRIPDTTDTRRSKEARNPSAQSSLIPMGEVGRALLLCSGLLFVASCAHASPPQSSPSRIPSPVVERSPSPSAASEPPAATILGKDPRGCTWVESSGSAVRGDEVRPAVIKGLAVARAEDRAIRTFQGGEDVESSFLSAQSSYAGRSDQYVESDLRSQKNTRILEEVPLASTPSIFEGRDCGGCLRTRIMVRIKACLLKLPPERDRLLVQLTLNQTFYRAGDMAIAHVFLGQDSYLYLIDENPADHTFSIIAPNPQFLPVWHARAGETVSFPSTEISREGIALQAELPKNASESHEILRVIATTKPLPPQTLLAGYKTVYELFSRLLREGISFNDSAETFTIVGSAPNPVGDQKTIRLRSATTH